MLGHPAFISSLHRSYAQSVALFAEQSVATVARSKRPDLARLRKMTNVFMFFIASPGVIRLVGREWRAHRVQSTYEVRISAQSLQHMVAHARHHVHAHHYVHRVRKLYANSRYLRPDRPHAIGHHIHRPAHHAALEQAA